MKILPVLVALTISGCMHIFHHDEDAAATQAIEYAKVAFIAHDNVAGYNLLADQVKKIGTVEQYAQVVAQMHPNGFPTTVTATQFEPIPGQPALNIILVGKNGDQNFFYLFTMLGTADSGYKVGRVVRGNEPYLGSPSIHGTKMLQSFKKSHTAAVRKQREEVDA